MGALNGRHYLNLMILVCAVCLTLYLLLQLEMVTISFETKDLDKNSSLKEAIVTSRTYI